VVVEDSSIADPNSEGEDGITTRDGKGHMNKAVTAKEE
jgi:hypothetical protein